MSNSRKKAALRYHSRYPAGKIAVVPTKPLHTQWDLSLAYTPGVAEPCREIHANPDKAMLYTARGNLVAVVTNGTAVLGLGNIGPLAAKPVMEGKANLFKRFADIDVFDIELDADDPDDFIRVVKALAPTVGGINIEDVKAPDCFYIEERLTEELDIPVFHDDQHGTSIITAAALLNACELSKRELSTSKIVFSGAGAAAIATAKLLEHMGAARENIWLCDSKGLVRSDRDDLNPQKLGFAKDSSLSTLADVVRGADVFIGVSVAGVLSEDMVQTMAARPIIFALANPDPEILPDAARRAAPDAIIATGRSDFPNQVNNVLGFPYLFRGALDCGATGFNREMMVAAVDALARLARADVPDAVLRAYRRERITFGPEYIIPKPLDPRVLLWVAPAVAKAAADTGVARAPIADLEAYREALERRVDHSWMVLRPLMNRAKGTGTRIVFPDGHSPRIVRAAHILVEEEICVPILIGRRERIDSIAAEFGLSLDGIEILNARTDERVPELAQQLWEKRQRKGVTKVGARRTVRSAVGFASMLVATGRADGLVGGLDTSYAETVRPALQIIGRDPNVSRVSGVYCMIFQDRRLFLGDCTVNVDPDAEALAQIALNTASIAESLGHAPKVAMLSYSDFGEHGDHSQAQRIQAAIRTIKSANPDFIIDGEMHADTAVNPAKAERDFPFCDVQGDANVLIFPNLTSGNIAYKLLRDLGGATALGPVLVGLNAPVNVLAISSTVSDIVNTTAITVNQALDRATTLAKG